MCGIIGYIGDKDGAMNVNKAIRALYQRGPDAQRVDCFNVGNVSVALGHTRFAIIDINERSNQPFYNDDQSKVITLNGEIYNYRAVAQELRQQGINFHTMSDTEVFLKAYEFWGVDCFERLEGFWAAAIYDLKEKKMILSRDRMGKAPLYYSMDQQAFMFASNIRALRQLTPLKDYAVNEQVARRYLIYAAKDVDQQTFFDGIYQFPKASWARIDLLKSLPDTLTTFNFYQFNPKRQGVWVDDAHALTLVKDCRQYLDDAVRKRLVADVSIAFELSGGVDSSAILASALAQMDPKDVHAYTVKFSQEDQDEEPYAQLIWKHYQQKFHYHVITPNHQDTLVNLQEQLMWMEEPIFSPGGSGGFTYQFLAQAMAKDGHRVVISGSSGDELLGGYPEEFFYLYIESLLKSGNTRKAKEELQLYSEKQLDIDNVLSSIDAIKNYNVPYQERIKPYIHGADSCIYNTDCYTFSDKILHWYTEFKVPYWLRAIDKNLMHIPLEGRYPFLDPALAQFCCEIPESVLFRNGFSKWILRKAVEPDLPADIVWRRRKMGFPFPIKTFMRSQKEYFMQVLEAMAQDPILNAKAIMRDYDQLVETLVYGLWRSVNYAMWKQNIFN